MILCVYTDLTRQSVSVENGCVSLANYIMAPYSPILFKFLQLAPVLM